MSARWPSSERRRRWRRATSEVGGLIAAIKRRQGKWEESLATFEKNRKTRSTKPEHYSGLLFTNTALRRWPEASRWATQMRAMAPASLVAKVQSGYVDFWWKGDTRPLRSMLSPGAGRNRSRWRDHVVLVGRGDDRAQFRLRRARLCKTRSLTRSRTQMRPLLRKVFFEGCIELAPRQAGGSPEIV